jgi:nucleoside-diphosphate-sugar epimerase
MDLSLYGATGIIGTYYKNLFPIHEIHKESLLPLTEEVLYLISTTDNSTFKDNPHLDINTNLVELIKRLDVCRRAGVKTFNFVSSWFVYGPDHEHPNEDVICNPNGFYSITKHTAEKLLVEYCTAFGINYRILRLGNVYGGPDQGTTKRNALHFLIEQLRQHKDVTIYLNLSRDFIHILDTCRAIEFICRQGELNTIYNIGTGQSKTLGYCLDKAKLLLRSKACVFRSNVPSNYNQAVRFTLDCTKLQTLGFKPLISLEEGLTDLCLHQKLCTPDRTLMEEKLRQLSNASMMEPGTQQVNK